MSEGVQTPRFAVSVGGGIASLATCCPQLGKGVTPVDEQTLLPSLSAEWVETCQRQVEVPLRRCTGVKIR